MFSFGRTEGNECGGTYFNDVGSKLQELFLVFLLFQAKVDGKCSRKCNHAPKIALNIAIETESSIIQTCNFKNVHNTVKKDLIPYMSYNTST